MGLKRRKRPAPRAVLISATPRDAPPWWPRNPDGTPSPVTLHSDGSGWTRGLDRTQAFPFQTAVCADLMEDFEFAAGGDTLGPGSLFEYAIVDLAGLTGA